VSSEQSLKDKVQANVQTSTKTVSHKFPSVAYMDDVEERASLVEFRRCIHMHYRNTANNTIQPCTVLVQPQVPLATIAAFFSTLSSYVSADPEKERRGSWVVGQLEEASGTWVAGLGLGVSLRRRSCCGLRMRIFICIAVAFLLLVLIAHGSSGD